MSYTKNPTWVDGEAGGTRIDAVDLNNIENGIFNAAATADAALPASQKGAANGVATLDAGTKLPTAQLPTHTHVAANVSDFSEAVDDRVAALVVAGTNITKTYDDVANTLTISAAGGGGGIAAIGQQFRSGSYYGPWRSIGGIYDTFAPVAGTLYANPLYVGEATTFNQIVITIQTAAAAGSRVRLGIYKSERLVPTTLMVDGGSVLTDTLGQKAATINTTLQPGLYWVVAVFNGAPQCRAVSCGVEGMYLRKGQSVGDWHDGNVTDNWRMTGYDPTVALPATASLTGLVDGSGVGRDVVNINVRAA